MKHPRAFPARRAGRSRGALPRRQRGVALIIALILVALATILATKLTFDGWLERRRTLGVLAAEQAVHFGLGAEALAADVLTQAANAQKVSLDQPWAQPTQPLPLTPENDAEGEPIGTLQGSLEDMQGRFNLNNLIKMVNDPTKCLGVPVPCADPAPLAQFQRLLVSVGLEPKWAGIARDWIDADDTPGNPDGAEDSVYTSQTPPYLTGNWPMSSPTELMNMPGFGADRYRKIAPYVTALPGITTINICTAPGPVLESLNEGLDGEYTRSPDLLVSGRKTGCFPDATAFGNILKGQRDKGAGAQNAYGTTSTFFRLTTRVTLGSTEFTMYSLLSKGAGKVTPLLRTFGTL
jgi:general secretion pathway protein K